MEKKKVAVVITTYKRPIEILARAIDSVLAQTYENYEIVVVNDYPEDLDLGKKIQEYISGLDRNNVRYISYEKNRGACAARNYGVKNSTSEYISFLDDDDEWLPTKLEEQIAAFTNEKVGLVYSPYLEYDKEQNGVVTNKTPLSDCPVKQLLASNFIGGCSMVTVSRNAFNQVGGFDETFFASQDYDLWMRIIQRFNAVYVGIPLIKRYLGDDSISCNFKKKKQGWEKFINRNIKLYMEWPDIYNYKLNSIAAQSIWFGEKEYTYKCWKKAIKIKPFLIKNNLLPLRSLVSRILHKR